MFIYYICVYTILLAGHYTQGCQLGNCPTPESITPCVCRKDSRGCRLIHCDGYRDINLKQVFKSMSRELHGNNRELHVFSLTNTRVTELPENVFASIQFDVINITNAYNLRRINSKAFYCTNAEIQSFKLENTPVIVEHPDYDLFQALDSMEGLRSIHLINTGIREIPDLAFKNTHQKLTHITITDSPIARIGARAFQPLAALSHLEITSTGTATAVGESGLAFRCGLHVTIHLAGNTHFDDQTFAGNEATIALKLREYKYVDWEHFREYFQQNAFNSLELTMLDCQDCRNGWLRSKALHRRMEVRWCSNNKVFHDVQNFHNCTKLPLPPYEQLSSHTTRMCNDLFADGMNGGAVGTTKLSAGHPIYVVNLVLIALMYYLF